MSKSESQELEVPPRLVYHWIKSRLFRVVHADGAYGGVSSRGYLHFAVYNERAAIPRRSERDITVREDAGVVVGPERTIEVRDGMVREVEIEVLMDYKTSLEFLSGLSRRSTSCSKSMGRIRPMMTKRSNTSAGPNAIAFFQAASSSSASSAIGSGRFYTGGSNRLLLLLADWVSESSHVESAVALIDRSFDELERRILSEPDQDLLDAAESLALQISLRKSAVSDDWIEAISDRWADFRD